MLLLVFNKQLRQTYIYIRVHLVKRSCTAAHDTTTVLKAAGWKSCLMSMCYTGRWKVDDPCLV